MRILVAGSQGQLAQALAEAAAARPEVTALALGRPALDLTRTSGVLAALLDFTPDVIVNAAAYTAVDKAESEPEAAMALNADGPRRLAEAANRMGAALIHISTDYVFDGTKPTPYVEDDPTAPLGAYGASKLAGEVAVRETLPRHVILRTAWVHSPFGTNFVKTMLRLAREREEIRVVADQIGTPTYAPHLADAVLAIAGSFVEPLSRERWGTYHAAGRGEATWHELACEVMRVSESLGGPAARIVPITTAEYPTPARRPANSRLACGKLEGAFAVRLPDWREGVATCVTRLLARG